MVTCPHGLLKCFRWLAGVVGLSSALQTKTKIKGKHLIWRFIYHWWKRFRYGASQKKTSSVTSKHNPYLSYSFNEKMIFLESLRLSIRDNIYLTATKIRNMPGSVWWANVFLRLSPSSLLTSWCSITVTLATSPLSQPWSQPDDESATSPSSLISLISMARR